MTFNQYTKFTILCNSCFLLTFINHYTRILFENGASSTIIILGQVVAFFATIVYFIWAFLHTKKNNLNLEQKILFGINVGFLLLITYYYFLY